MFVTSIYVVYVCLYACACCRSRYLREKLARIKNEKKLLVVELRSLRERGLYSTASSSCMRSSGSDVGLQGKVHEHATEKMDIGNGCLVLTTDDGMKGGSSGSGGEGRMREGKEEEERRGGGDDNYCVEKIAELLLRKALIDETLLIESGIVRRIPILLKPIESCTVI